MSKPPFVYRATEENFQTLVVENSFKGPVLVDFWAAGVGPSRRQAEVLARLAEDYRGRFLLVSVDTDHEKGIAARFGVRSLPSCKLFRRGVPVEHVHGMQSEADYRALIERHLLGPASALQAQALASWRGGDHDQAIRILAEGAVARPDDLSFPTLMAKLLIQDGRIEDAFALLDALPPAMRDDAAVQRLLIHLILVREAMQAAPAVDLEAILAESPDQLEARLALAATRLIEDDVESALALFAEIHRQDPRFRDGIGRRGLIAVMEHVGRDDPRVGRYRRLLFPH
ncbi:putative thioredoxin protein [Thiocapsa sp. KS1]|nr:tetratricopeptide repeat protein [Thiocapsa sp. KS1]CRI67912.1 putative thioredoxin protein [Thiocapsa sp. KS1]